MSYTNIQIKTDSTINVTIRKTIYDTYIVIALHESWRKSHAVKVARPYIRANGKQFDCFGKAFAYVKKHMRNAVMKKQLQKPLATTDSYHDKIEDIPICYNRQ